MSYMPLFNFPKSDPTNKHTWFWIGIVRMLVFAHNVLNTWIQRTLNHKLFLLCASHYGSFCLLDLNDRKRTNIVQKLTCFQLFFLPNRARILGKDWPNSDHF